MAILPLSFRFNENVATIRFKRTYLSGILFLLGRGWAGLGSALRGANYPSRSFPCAPPAPVRPRLWPGVSGFPVSSLSL